MDSCFKCSATLLVALLCTLSSNVSCQRQYSQRNTRMELHMAYGRMYGMCISETYHVHPVFIIGAQELTYLTTNIILAYFLHPCSSSDPNINQCFTHAANHLAENFKRGIPELGVTEVEPIILDEINLALGAGPDGYRATFRDVEAYGVSNLTITGVRSDLNTLQFQLAFYIPKISVRANYRSSGVLIMVQATGGGDYWGEYGGVRAKVYFRAVPQDVDGQQYLKLEDLKMDFSVKELQMGIRNVHNGNGVLEAALNLFINSNAQELLKEMKPSIKKKLLVTMRHFIDNLFDRIPYSYWITD